jgi:hypothetical protein
MNLLEIRVEAKDCCQTLHLERVSGTKLDGIGTLMVASVVSNPTSIKAFRAGLFSKGASFVVVQVNRWGNEVEHRLARYENGYTLKTHRLAGDTFQLLAVARLPGLLTVSSDEGLWRELSGPRFTTPVLREWVPWLRQRLEAEEWLQNVDSVQCNAVRLTVTEEQLDGLVCEGLREGRISI